ncbi:MAG: SpoIID/LytB domain-containing protein [Actinomycetota bacterium]|nr:SpoIID/LytB domain-containing protein [Actinomycetota bacterium]
MSRWSRRALAVALGSALVVPVTGGATPAVAATCPEPGGVTIARAPLPEADVVFRGRGWGHQMGMSQYGAQGAASLGCTYRDILATYYPGTTLGSRTQRSAVKIDMLTNGGSATLTAETGGVTWLVTGGDSASQPKGATWKVVRYGSGARVWDGASYVLTVPAGGEVRVPHSGTVVRVRTYTAGGSAVLDRRMRWDSARFTADSAGLDVREVIEDNANGDGVTKYLKGIAEMPVSWRLEALKAQATTARTFMTTRWSSAEGAYLLLPTPAHQNYLGYDQESTDARYGGNWARAVEETRSGDSGTVVLDDAGRPIDGLYSSSFGGRSEDREYVWGSYGIPYLKAVDDSRWEMAAGSNARRAWAARFSFADVAKRLGFDNVETITLRRWGGTERLEGITVVGARRGVRSSETFTGWDLRQTFGLYSPGFSIRAKKIGTARAVAVAGDWDGNGDSDTGWWRDGEVALRTGSGVVRFRFGTAGDRPVVGDWDGDGRDEIGVVRGATWYLRNSLSSGAASTSFTYGRTTGDLPVVGDWDGDGKDGPGVVRGSYWHLRNSLSSGAAQTVFRFGDLVSGDRPVAGDWDGDGDDTPGYMHGRTWRLRNSNSSGAAHHTLGYGLLGDKPVVGDWNRDGRTTLGVARATAWHLDDAMNGGSASSLLTFAG